MPRRAGAAGTHRQDQGPDSQARPSRRKPQGADQPVQQADGPLRERRGYRLRRRRRPLAHAREPLQGGHLARLRREGHQRVPEDPQAEGHQERDPEGRRHGKDRAPRRLCRPRAHEPGAPPRDRPEARPQGSRAHPETQGNARAARPRPAQGRILPHHARPHLARVRPEPAQVLREGARLQGARERNHPE